MEDNELNRKAAVDIISAFEAFVESGINEDNSKLAEYAYLKYFPSVSFLSDYVYEAKLKLFPIAYPNAEVSVSIPTSEEARNIISELKRLHE